MTIATFRRWRPTQVCAEREVLVRSRIRRFRNGQRHLSHGRAFDTPELLGVTLTLREECHAFDADFECTSKGADLRRVALDVRDGTDAGATTVRSGDGRSMIARDRTLNVWLGRALQ